MKKNTNKEYAIALFEATKDLKGAKLSLMIEAFAKLLFRSGVSKQINSIISEYIKYSKKEAGIVDIEITSAHDLSHKLVEEIKKRFGDKVEATQMIDAEILGGIKIKTENMIFDGSLRKQLQLLKQSFN
ncbi:MAG: F0F1 ATP synthase subunit delta [Patescibacteria group bacterium]|jgi:F-type H+-transporting ATPase subunit delta